MISIVKTVEITITEEHITILKDICRLALNHIPQDASVASTEMRELILEINDA